MTGENVADSRYELFEAARRSAGWTIEQLWISYLALGGTLVVFDLELYLAGLAPMPADQQDVLACALNERFADLAETVRVPYLHVLAVNPCPENPLGRLEPLEGPAGTDGGRQV